MLIIKSIVLYLKNRCNFKNKYNLNILYVLSFVLIAFISGVFLLHSHILFSGNGIDGGYDMIFHFQRIEALTKSIEEHHYLPSLMFNAMSSNGNAVMQFYPYITLYPIALLFVFIKPTITSIYFIFIALIFISLLLSFYSSLSVSENKLISYMFAIFYSLSSMIMFYAFEAVDVGALMAMVVLPISIFGFIDLLRKYRWLKLAIGVILLIFSHALTSFILIITFITWFLCTHKRYDYKIWLQLLKASVVTILTTAIWWLPCLYLMLNNKLQYPSNFGLTGATDIVHLVTLGLHDNVQMSDMISFVAVIGLLFIPFFWKKFNRYVKQMALVASISLALTTSILPWGQPGVAPWIEILHTPLSILQFTWRLDVIPELCLTYIAAFCIVKFLNFRKSVIPIIFLLTIGGQIVNQNQIIRETQNSHVTPLKSYIFYHDNMRYSTHRYYINKNNQFKYVLNSPISVSTIPDYYPKATQPMDRFISDGNGAYMGTKVVKIKSLGNGNYRFNINPKKIIDLNLPIIKYDGIKYRVYLDNNLIKSKYGNDYLLVPKILKHGHHRLHIKVIYPKTMIVSKYLSGLGVILIGSYLIYVNIRKRRNI